MIRRPKPQCDDATRRDLLQTRYSERGLLNASICRVDRNSPKLRVQTDHTFAGWRMLAYSCVVNSDVGKQQADY